MAKKAKKRKPAKRAASSYWMRADDLREKGACDGAINLFVRVFGEQGAPITHANVLKASKYHMSLSSFFDMFYFDYDATDHYLEVELPKARTKYGSEKVASAHAFMATIKKFPPEGLLPPKEAKAQAKAITQIKALVEKHHIVPKQLGYAFTDD